MKIFSTWRELFFLIRHPYLWFRKPIEISSLEPDPIAQFEHWYKLAERKSGGEFHNWFCLSTVGPQGEPEGRIVLLKSFDQRGFVFYTNIDSQKGSALSIHPHAAMTFYWDALQRQVRIRGKVKVISDKEADAYFNSRPRQSQLGAWASLQSSRLESREELTERLESFKQQYQNQKIPRPPYWTGFRIEPTRFEFWELRLSRLHDRFIYQQEIETHSWCISRLYP